MRTLRKWNQVNGAYDYLVLRDTRITFIFAWYDLWIGAFWDRKARKLYILPVPCIGIVFQFDQSPSTDQQK